MRGSRTRGHEDRRPQDVNRIRAKPLIGLNSARDLSPLFCDRSKSFLCIAGRMRWARRTTNRHLSDWRKPSRSCACSLRRSVSGVSSGTIRTGIFSRACLRGTRMEGRGPPAFSARLVRCFPSFSASGGLRWRGFAKPRASLRRVFAVFRGDGASGNPPKIVMMRRHAGSARIPLSVTATQISAFATRTNYAATLAPPALGANGITSWRSGLPGGRSFQRS